MTESDRIEQRPEESAEHDRREPVQPTTKPRENPEIDQARVEQAREEFEKVAGN